MWKWLRELDRILRGEATQLAAIRQGTIDVPAAGLSVVIMVLGVVYGLCMGVFALVNRDDPEYLQVVASMVKVSALFFLTLLVTFPSLYVFNALVGSRLSVLSLARLLIASLGVNTAVLASFGPIVAFFSLTTPSYPFMKLLNVAVFGLSGMLGLVFLLQTLHRLSIVQPLEAMPAEAAPTPEAPVEVVPSVLPSGALDRLEGHVVGPPVMSVFRCWMVVFALVGAQMAWVLRPFIGNPDQPFTWFRQRESNFFEAVWRTLSHVFQ